MKSLHKTAMASAKLHQKNLSCELQSTSLVPSPSKAPSQYINQQQHTTLLKRFPNHPTNSRASNVTQSISEDSSSTQSTETRKGDPGVACLETNQLPLRRSNPATPTNPTERSNLHRPQAPKILPVEELN
ncbi:hypothetical protein M758_3G011800 [Ceratodon purpureus]|uniref:Uncharacterized protein n=1 Tax=Ceratodon purpureus TaxID=3225 RepID=A0A8T0IFP4_CERPU|nr:hypothetical protein KC19_3G011700 [Ceratodon purpureus]KAG0621334.1 hypothetical protein M758_3G011800 [Ceratodon purpureus]